MTGDALDQQTTLAWQSYAENIALRAENERLMRHQENAAELEEANERLRAENERLREALKTIIDGIPAVRGESYRKDGVISKCDKCPHDRYIYEGCEECVSDFARAALAGGKE